MHIIKQIMDSKSKISLLGLLLDRPDTFSLSELSRLSELPKATVSGIITDWEKVGIVIVELQGRNKNMKLNQKFYILPEIRKMYQKSGDFNKPLFNRILSLHSVKDKRTKAVLVFGSRTREDYTQSSDVDVMIGVEGRFMPFTEELSLDFAKLYSETGIRFSPHFYDRSEIWQRIKKKDNLMENILREGIILKGREWIERIQAPS